MSRKSVDELNVTNNWDAIFTDITTKHHFYYENYTTVSNEVTYQHNIWLERQ